jgi:hypothetical protein
MKAVEKGGERLLGLDVDPGGRLVEDQQLGLGRKRLGDERPLLLTAGEPGERPVGDLREPDPADRLVHVRPVVPPEAPEQPRARQSSGRHDLANGRRRVEPQLSTLRQVAERVPAPEPVDWLAEESSLAAGRALEAEHEPEERRLAAAVRPRDRDELSARHLEVEALEDGRAARIREGHSVEHHSRR